MFYQLTTYQFMKKKTTKKSTTAKKIKKAGRTVAVITGLKPGDKKLPPQPCQIADVAFRLGRVDRATFLADLKNVIDTVQPIGRLFSFEKPKLIKGGYIKFSKVARDKWLEETQPAPTTPPPTPPEPAAAAETPAAEPVAEPAAAS